MPSIEILEYRQLLSNTVAIDAKTYASLNAGSTKSDYTGCGLNVNAFGDFAFNMFSVNFTTSAQFGSCASLLKDYTSAIEAAAASQQTINTQTLANAQKALTDNSAALTAIQQSLQASATNKINSAVEALSNYTADNKVLLQLIADAGKFTSLNSLTYVFNDPGLAASALSYINIFNVNQIALSATNAIQKAFSTW